MNHHTPGVNIGPGATGTCDFPGVDPESYLVVILGPQGEKLSIAWEFIDGGLRVYATNFSEQMKLFRPMVKDGR